MKKRLFVGKNIKYIFLLILAIMLGPTVFPFVIELVILVDLVGLSVFSLILYLLFYNVFYPFYLG